MDELYTLILEFIKYTGIRDIVVEKLDHIELIEHK